jgi:hypothetical protein
VTFAPVDGAGSAPAVKSAIIEAVHGALEAPELASGPRGAEPVPLRPST